MMHQVPCVDVRTHLAAFHDGELALDQQVLIQTHLQECVACRLEAGALADLGEAMRAMAGTLAVRTPVETGRITGAVLERLRIEQQFAWSVRLRDLFQDMHLVWAGLGATAAVFICVFASMGVLQAASQEKPESLAGIITSLANQGSNDYPVRLAGSMLVPRVVLASPMPATAEDSELALSAVVTREGRIQNLALLEEQALALHMTPEVVMEMMDAASRSRFTPALAGGLPIAVNVVWLVTSTTVKGLPDYDLYLVKPPRWRDPVHGPTPPKRTVPAVKTPAAGDDGGLNSA